MTHHKLSISAESRRFVSGDLKWDYLVCGEGERVMVLVPGVLGGPETMEQQIAALSKSFRVIALSLPCFADLDQFCNCLDDLLTRELAGQVVLSGSSFGGLLVQAFLFRKPQRVSGIILSDTGLPNRERGNISRLVGSVARFLPFPIARWLFLAKINYLLDYPVPENKKSELEARREKLQEWVQHHLTRKLLLNRLDLATAFDCREKLDLQALKVWPGRILITYSEDDPSRDEGTPMEQVYPHAGVFVFPDGGHLAQMVHFDRYIQVVSEFVAAC